MHSKRKNENGDYMCDSKLKGQERAKLCSITWHNFKASMGWCVWVSCRGMGSVLIEKFALSEIASRL